MSFGHLSLFCALLKATLGPRFRGSRSVVTPLGQVCRGRPTGLFQVLWGGPVIAFRALAWSSSASQRAMWPKSWSLLLSTISNHIRTLVDGGGCEVCRKGDLQDPPEAPALEDGPALLSGPW